MIQKLKRIRSSSLFQSLFLIQMLLLACMLIYLTFFMDRYVLQTQVQKADHSNLQILEQVNTAVDQQLGDLQQQVRIFLSSQTVMRYLYCTSDVGLTQSADILKDLKHYAELTPGVERLWFYAPYPGMILSSDGYITTLSSSSHISMVLERYEQQFHARSDPDYFLAAIPLDGQLYILIDFVPAQRLGCFIFQVDARRFVNGLNGGEQPILMVGADGALILDDGALAYETQYFSLSNRKLFYTASETERTGEQEYYRVENETLGWSILMPLTDTAAFYSNPATYALLLPTMLLLLLLSAVCAWFISVKIYAPINHLLTLVMEKSATQLPPAKDFDYLKSAYERAFEDNQELRTQFSQLSQSISQYLCRKAIDGVLSPEDEADSIGSLIPGGSFQLALLRLSDGPSEFGVPIKRQLQLSAVESIAAQLPECLCCLIIDEDTLALIFHLPSSAAPDRAQQLMEEFVPRAAGQTQCALIYGLGGSCSGLAQLNESMKQATRDLQYNIYIAADPDPDSARAIRNIAVEERIRQVIDNAIFAQDALDGYVEQITQLAEQNVEDDTERVHGYETVQGLLLERLLFQEEVTQALPAFRPSQTSAQVRADFMLFCRRALELGRSMSSQKKFRYVDEAKKYIQENYMNCSLGANDISSHIGISVSYFSSLFNELLQESVVSYLNRVRVEHAKVMLTMTGVPVKDVGFRCGFNSANVFGRVFKKYTGLTPKQYREDSTAQEEGNK